MKTVLTNTITKIHVNYSHIPYVRNAMIFVFYIINKESLLLNDLSRFHTWMCNAAT